MSRVRITPRALRLTRGTTGSDKTHEALLLGWHGFSTSLHHHHSIEDAHIWPTIRDKLADRPDDLAVLTAMEDEHARIDPAIAAVEAAFADRDAGFHEVAEPIAYLVDLLRSHLAHEERDAFPLIRTLVTKPEWDALNKASMKELTYSEIAGLRPLAAGRCLARGRPPGPRGAARTAEAGPPALVEPPIPQDPPLAVTEAL